MALFLFSSCAGPVFVSELARAADEVLGEHFYFWSMILNK